MPTVSVKFQPVLVALLVFAVQIVDVDAQTGPTGKQEPKQVELGVREKTALGAYLADGEGRAVYSFQRDRPGVSMCDGICTGDWPPVLTAGKPKAGDRIDAGKIGTIRRDDGGTQVTYAGWPLYYWKMDQNVPGATVGQAIVSHGGMWYLLTPEGEPITAKRAGEFPEAEKQPDVPGNVGQGGRSREFDQDRQSGENPAR